MRLLLASLVLFAAGLAPAASQGRAPQPWSGARTLALDLPDLQGKRQRLQDYRGKVVLVNFWATWCEPCRAEMPSIARLKASLAGRPFEVFAVNYGEPEARIQAFMKKVPMPFPVLLDRDSAAAKAWGAKALPATFLVGPDGTIRYWHRGEYDWSQPSARRLVEGLLPK